MKSGLVLAVLVLPVLAQAAAPGNDVERGRLLVQAGACNDCHTPHRMGPNGPEPDMSRQLSGHPAGLSLPPPPKASGPWVWGGSSGLTAFYGPWGVSYAQNLTPDKETGLGGWTEEQFVQALQTGRHMGQDRPILPPMPWSWYAQLPESDLRAIFRYLQTLPPVQNRVPAPELKAPPASPLPESGRERVTQ